METYITGESCPFPDGVYQTSYSESENVTAECIGQGESVITVTGDTLHIKLCSATNTLGEWRI